MMNNNYEFDQGDQSSNSTNKDWTELLPGDTIIQLFSLLDYCDRANLASVSPSLRSLAASPCLWRSLDFGAHKFDISTAISLASRCSSLEKLCFQGEESTEAIISLNVTTLIEIRGNFYEKVNDTTLSIIVDMNRLLEIIEFGSSYCNGISSEGIKSIAMCCLNLKKIWLSGVKDVNSIAINALGNSCHSLVEIAFTDCGIVDEIALTNLVSLKFLSIAGTSELDSDLVIEHWVKFENLLALDVSRTNISANAIDRLLSYSPTLKVICALNCEMLEKNVNFKPSNKMGIELISMLTYIPTLLLVSQDIVIMPWIEQVLSRSLLHLAKFNNTSMTYFWVEQGGSLMIILLRSSEEEVQKRAIRGIANSILALTDLREEEVSMIHERRKESMEDEITSILNLVKSSGEGVKLEVAKALNMLFYTEEFAFVTISTGGVEVVMKLLESMNIFIVEEATNALRHMFEVGNDVELKNEYKSIILECGGSKVLKNLLKRWPLLSENVLKNVVGALAIMTSDNEINVRIIINDCLDALVAITQECVFVGVLEKAACVFANVIRFGLTNDNNIIVGHKLCVLKKLVQLIRSPDEHIRQETAKALRNLSLNEWNRDAIVAVEGIEALVYLAKETTNYSWMKWKKANGGENLDETSEPNNIAVGQIRRFGSLMSDAPSIKDDIHLTIIKTFWNLEFKSDIALHVVEKEGIQVLIRICLVSGSELTRLMAVLVMAYIFHILPEGCKYIIRNSSNEPTKALMIGMKYIEDYINIFLDDETLKRDHLSLKSMDLYRIAKSALLIKDVYKLECSRVEVGRFVNMLRSSSSPIQTCGAFALMQFTTFDCRMNKMQYLRLLTDKESISILQSTLKSSSASVAAKIFSKIVLHHLI